MLDLDMENKIDHSLQLKRASYIKVCKIAKFGCEVLYSIQNILHLYEVCEICIYIRVTRKKSYHFFREIPAKMYLFSRIIQIFTKFTNFAKAKALLYFTTFCNQTLLFL